MSTEITKQSPKQTVGFSDTGSFELLQRAAKMLATSTLVPKEYQDNISNCAIALNMAVRINADPVMVMQNLVIVHNRPTWSSQFLIATVNACGRFSSLRYEFFGDRDTDGWGCRAWAVERETGEKLVGTDVTIAIAKKEGWFGKNGSKWQSIPQQMLMYRAASWWTRAYAPELSMGLHTADEVEDFGSMKDITPPESSNAIAAINAAIMGEPSVLEVVETEEDGTMVVNLATGEISFPEEPEPEPENDTILDAGVQYHLLNSQSLKACAKKALTVLADMEGDTEAAKDWLASVGGVALITALSRKGLGIEAAKLRKAAGIETSN